MKFLKSKKGISLVECAVALVVFAIISVSALSIFSISSVRNNKLLEQYNGWILTDNVISCFQSAEREGVDQTAGQFLKILGEGAVKLSYPYKKEVLTVDAMDNTSAIADSGTTRKVEVATYYYWYIPSDFTIGCFIEANYTQESIVIYNSDGEVEYDPNIKVWVMEASEVRKLINDSSVGTFLDSDIEPDVTYRKG